MELVLQHVGKMIREIRKAQGLSQEQLAERVGTKHTDIGKLERGERNVTLKTLVRVASSLGIEIHKLFEYDIQSKSSEKEYLISMINKTLVNLPNSDLKKVLTILNVIYNEEQQ
ncbi:helix-turn-helix transcriptional regulator [Brevibacillus sp. AG]|uniref:helix-turn-helix domain-containing protein n=1 Tax=Brevibacillus sp. AG TaxID=3020891 RepID=UPI00232DE91B|nr:helix-turn-helix transcriptional regulator [Brevibacillus sp. AG]MDC0764929.1 helix-turn-helix transcriptional regulator [Brevibacillus sp. AG]